MTFSTKTQTFERLTLCLGILFLSFNAHNQTAENSFEIINSSSFDNSNNYKQAIMAASFDTFRLKNERVTLVFANGLQVELLSATELKSIGTAINLDDYREQNLPDYVMPTFELAPNGYIVAKYLKTLGKENQVN